MILTQLQAYGITMAVEAGVCLALAPLFGAKRWRAALVAIGSTAFTHPAIWHGAHWVHRWAGDYTIAIIEAFAVLAEMIAYRVFATRRWRDAFFLSLIANMASFGLGELIYALA
jgi:hypothetical protein